ncbi:putative damage-inducible protein DinB [Pullulanibacillus pueri]|uniref:DUF664 domain-containing protein n=1 Tax=Pullulanibacillus pueri TaxID=1437324 RepID=A0A8J2ZTU6_9BACL|nr:DinB family protein [Pullulanibacillus pueri]MBM7681149.1 putative damage-inducible protein DinB [Pullulanibacillus pueri]GGH77237.1 hypothetical protein GCM10007096_08840 [Pullulanibacillus pueri]
MIDYRIMTQEGYTENIGSLVSMLTHSRKVTLSEIADLTPYDLDFLSDEKGNTIGALLLHIAAIEAVHQVISFEKRDFTDEEYAKWGTALTLGEKARREIKGFSGNYYLSQLSEVRKKTLQILQTKTDEWLLEESYWPNGVAYNNYYLWFHVMEDEINHRGQIRTLKRLIATSTS